TAEFHATDPDNRRLWRFSRRRLAADEIRDAMLAVAGTINLKASGPSAIAPVDQELVDLLYKPSQWEVTPDEREHHRRSIYLIAKRNLRLPFMEVFDQPDLQTSCARRESSTHSPQALEMLNGKLSNQLAAAFAERLREESGPAASDQVELAYRLVAGREPTDKERELSAAFLAKYSLTEFASAMFNLNAFLYVECSCHNVELREIFAKHRHPLGASPIFSQPRSVGAAFWSPFILERLVLRYRFAGARIAAARRGTPRGDAQSAGPQATASCRSESQIGDLLVHGGRAEPCRDV
ncbi:MAG: DUF1553 domain-containing protein, partial [Planctomycetia bacterium]|nr:DUF1553 domain-containing protein [Planctomycetia bacterium]